MGTLTKMPEENLKKLRKAKHQKLVELVKKSDRLLKNTLMGNENIVKKR